MSSQDLLSFVFQAGEPSVREVNMNEDELPTGDFMNFLDDLESGDVHIPSPHARGQDFEQTDNSYAMPIQFSHTKNCSGNNLDENLRLEKNRAKNRRGQARYREKCKVCSERRMLFGTRKYIFEFLRWLALYSDGRRIMCREREKRWRRRSMLCNSAFMK
jgi:hypothetical protein